METIALINPSRRRRGGRKHRSAAQRRATRRMLAANRARRGGSRRRRRHASRAVGAAVLTNPRRRRSRSRRMRRNPISLNVRGIAAKPMQFLAPALTGAVGAIVVNTTLSKLAGAGVIPLTLMTGRVRYLTQAGAAIALGMVAQKFGVKSAMARQAAEGALTVTLVDAIKDFAGSAGVTLGGGMGYYLPARQMTPQGRQLQGIGKYVSGPGAPVVPFRRTLSGAGGRIGAGGFGR